MRGVLNELDKMAQPEHVLSAPVRALLGETDFDVYTACLQGRVPAVLSGAQKQVIEAARDQSITLVVGPPGTGKSFTIASLAIDTASRGFSTLIASKMNHAVDVVGDKIDNTLGVDGLVIRGRAETVFEGAKGPCLKPALWRSHHQGAVNPRAGSVLRRGPSQGSGNQEANPPD